MATRGGHRLVIARAACVEPAILFDELEGVARPVFALGFDDVDVCEQQNRLGVPVADPLRPGTAFEKLVDKCLS